MHMFHLPLEVDCIIIQSPEVYGSILEETDLLRRAWCAEISVELSFHHIM